MVSRIQQTVKVVVGAQPEKKKRRRRRAAPKKKAGPTYIERFIAHPGFAASQIIATPVSIKPSTFEVSALQEYQIQRQRERAGGMQTSLERMKELAGANFDKDVVKTPRVDIPVLPFPALSPPPKQPRVRQPREETSAKKQAIAAYEAAFGEGKSEAFFRRTTVKKLRELVEKM